jgi:hypothetical protein
VRHTLRASCGLAVLAVLAACGSKSPTTPTPSNGGNGGQVAPPNSPPVIDGIAVKGSRVNEPVNFADVAETVQVTAAVRDAETSPSALQYQWSADAGTFSGAGAAVTWTAPASVPAGPVTISLTVVESFGAGSNAGQNKVSSTAPVSVHDSIKEVGDMSRQFLLDFSDTNITDAGYIMRNFSKARCPQPSEVDAERDDVVKNYTNFTMQSFRIGTPAVTVAFGGSCPVPGRAAKRGDACAIVPSFWDSILHVDNIRRAVDGNDIIAAAYSGDDKRWWLCASAYDAHLVSGPPFPAGFAVGHIRF